MSQVLIGSSLEVYSSSYFFQTSSIVMFSSSRFLIRCRSSLILYTLSSISFLASLKMSFYPLFSQRYRAYPIFTRIIATPFNQFAVSSSSSYNSLSSCTFTSTVLITLIYFGRLSSYPDLSQALRSFYIILSYRRTLLSDLGDLQSLAQCLGLL